MCLIQHDMVIKWSIYLDNHTNSYELKKTKSRLQLEKTENTLAFSTDEE